MSLSLSQLFAQHQSQNSSEPKTEESHKIDENKGSDIGDGSINRFLIDSEQTKDIGRNSGNVAERKQSKKRARTASPRESGGKSESTAKTKRIKPEPSNNIKNERDVEAKIEYSGGEEYEEDEEDDGIVDRVSNQRFYQNYSESVKVLYNSQKDGSEQKRKALGVVNLALCPPKNKGTENERRLPGNCDDDNEGIPSRSLTGRYLPRKKRVVTKISSRKFEVSYRLETQEEIQLRVKCMEGYAKRDALRKRWQNRTVNFQSEQDVGDAFWLRAQETIGERLRSDEKERRMKVKREKKEGLKKEKKEELKRMKELERSDLLEEDDEVKEQSQLLAQLTQPEITPKREGNDSSDPISIATTNNEKMNYWELGYTMPKSSSITFDFDPSVEKMVQSGSKGAFETSAKLSEDNGTKDETRASFSALVRKQDGARNLSRFFFEPNRALISNGKSTFRPGYRSGHIQHLLNMAARSLCGGSGSVDDNIIDLENHYLCLLCKQHEDESKKQRHLDSTICADLRKKGFLTTIAEEQGKNMLLFLQNTWNDPTEVAEQLGIMDCSKESPIGGNLLTNIKDHFKKKRLQIRKLHRIRSVDWKHENNNDDDDDIESDHEDGENETGMSSHDKIIGEVTTNGGVVDAMTMETSMTIDKKSNFGPSNGDRDALISPTTFYSHIAGTSPPVPQLPLDPCAWIFGPVDRYSKFYHTSVRMDSSIYKIAVSTLMKRKGWARISKNDSILRNTDEQMLNLIEEFASINENKFYLQYTNMIQDPLDSDIPLVEFYRGVNGYCTYMANGFLETQKEPKLDPDGNEAGHEYDCPQQGSEMNLIAGKIWEFCQPKIRQNALLRFPKLRIVFGIALICRSINPSAAEILSRPIDNDGICTPLDLFKEALEDMESKKYIATAQNFEDNSIRAVELEFLLHDAAELFQEAVELDPTNVEYQLWHIGCLASCLLISSGNRICARSAHVYPSQMKGTFLDSIMVAHEVRPCMKKYKEVRVELSTAVKALLTLVKYQDSPRAHFAVFSILEWGQVVGLLVGTQLNNFLEDIHKHHAHHLAVWARHEPNTFLREYKGITQNICVASVYAQILENEPGEIINWRNFILCLGSISDTKNDDWWGKDRCWWGDSLLHIVLPNTSGRMLTEVDGLILKNVLGKLKKATVSSSLPTLNSSMMITRQKDDEDKNDDQVIDWLPTLESVMGQNDEEIKVSEEIRTRCYSKDLPRTEKNVPANKRDAASAFLSSISIPSSKSSLLQGISCLSHEVQVYKVFISCHLFGVDHPSVCKYIHDILLRNCIHNEYNEEVDENCDEFRVLVWLNSMNIDIEDIIQGNEHGKQ